MDPQLIQQAILIYICFIPVLTFHEFAHAWVASKCGDDTARSLGRVTLNPVKHMELIGTVVLPLTALFLQIQGSALGGFIIGWGKPVPVNINNLRSPTRDDTLIALAGPASNILLAFILMGIARIGQIAQMASVIEFAFLLVQINLILAFFNLIPIPPLDGSHVLKNAIGMSYETYYRLAQYGFIAVILVINIPGVRLVLAQLTSGTALLMARMFGMR